MGILYSIWKWFGVTWLGFEFADEFKKRDGQLIAATFTSNKELIAFLQGLGVNEKDHITCNFPESVIEKLANQWNEKQKKGSK